MALLAKNIAIKFASIPVIGIRFAELGMKWKLTSRVVTPYKAQNFLLAQRELESKAITVRSLPYILHLDTFNSCNLACPFCPTGTKQLVRKKMRLSIDKAKDVIDAVKSHVLYINLYNWGEPFLNPDIFEIINYASKSGIFTLISSNLSLKVENLAERVIDSGLDDLRVSMDGIEQSTLEKYRRRANCELVLENIRKIVELKRKRRTKKPSIQVKFLVFRHNEHEISRLPNLCRELGVDSFTPGQAFVYHESFVPRRPDYQPVQRIFSKPCHYLYTTLTTEADGHISPCCVNTNARFDLGTLEDLVDLSRFWNSTKFRAMRAFNAGVEYVSMAGKKEEILCQHCQFIGNEKYEACKLSPLPPSMIADGEEYDHGLEASSKTLNNA